MLRALWTIGGLSMTILPPHHFYLDPVWKVARYTTAAPVYFTECDDYVDGGVLANNPCSDALTKIQVHISVMCVQLFVLPNTLLCVTLAPQSFLTSTTLPHCFCIHSFLSTRTTTRGQMVSCLWWCQWGVASTQVSPWEILASYLALSRSWEILETWNTS